VNISLKNGICLVAIVHPTLGGMVRGMHSASDCKPGVQRHFEDMKQPQQKSVQCQNVLESCLDIIDDQQAQLKCFESHRVCEGKLAQFDKKAILSKCTQSKIQFYRDLSEGIDFTENLIKSLRSKNSTQPTSSYDSCKGSSEDFFDTFGPCVLASSALVLLVFSCALIKKTCQRSSAEEFPDYWSLKLADKDESLQKMNPITLETSLEVHQDAQAYPVSITHEDHIGQGIYRYEEIKSWVRFCEDQGVAITDPLTRQPFDFSQLRRENLC